MTLYWLEHTLQFLSFKDFIACCQVAKQWRETAANKNLPQYTISLPLSPTDFQLCPRRILPIATQLTFSTPINENMLFKAIPILERVEKMDLRGTNFSSILVEWIAKDSKALPSLKYLNLSNGLLTHNFCHFQTLAQTRKNVELIFNDTRFVSIRSTFETQITFCNTTKGRVEVYWLNFFGTRKFYKYLNADESYTQNTFKTHPWVIIDSEKREIMMVAGMKYPQVVRIGLAMPNLIPIPQVLGSVRINSTLYPIQIINQTSTSLYLSPLSPDGHPDPSYSSSSSPQLKIPPQFSHAASPALQFLYAQVISIKTDKLGKLDFIASALSPVYIREKKGDKGVYKKKIYFYTKNSL